MHLAVAFGGMKAQLAQEEIADAVDKSHGLPQIQNRQRVAGNVPQQPTCPLHRPSLLA